MWTGGKVRCLAPVFVGDVVTKSTRVTGVEEKQTRAAGAALFVTRESELFVRGNQVMTETTTHAYLPTAHARAPSRPSTAGDSGDSGDSNDTIDTVDTIDVDEVTLFEYSALTWNRHRIHYDYRHATQVEGYPGLVVHGPWIASLLLDQYQRRRNLFSGYEFQYRGRQPLYLPSKIHICFDDAAVLAAKNDRGDVVMEATVTQLPSPML